MKCIEILSKHKSIYDMFTKTGELVNFAPHIRSEVVNAYKMVDPYYHYNDRCQACIIDMLMTIYRWYETKTKI